MARWRGGAVARWRGGAVARWRGGAVARWRGGAVARWRGGAVARWRGGAVARWRGGAVARWRSGAEAQWLELRTLHEENDGYLCSNRLRVLIAEWVHGYFTEKPRWCSIEHVCALNNPYDWIRCYNNNLSLRFILLISYIVYSLNVSIAQYFQNNMFKR